MNTGERFLVSVLIMGAAFGATVSAVVTAAVSFGFWFSLVASIAVFGTVLSVAPPRSDVEVQG